MSNTGPITRDEVFTALLEASVHFFLRRLDRCRRLIDNAERDQGSAELMVGTDGHTGSLSAVKRRSIDRAVEQFFAEAPALAQSSLEQLIDAALPPGSLEEASDYPVRPEQSGAAGIVIANRGLRDKLYELAQGYEDDAAALSYLNSRLLAKVEEPAVDILCSALLPYVEAAFEQFLGALLRTTLNRHPKAFGSLGPVPEQVFEQYSKEDAQAYLIDHKIETLLNGPPDKWQGEISKSIGIDISQPPEDWQRVVESVQRRHVLIHNGGLVDDEYRKNLPTREQLPAIGEPLVTGPDYLHRVLLSYRTIAIVATLRWAGHFKLPDPFALLPNLISEIVDLERRDDWVAAGAITEAALAFPDTEQAQTDADAHALLRINWWLCRLRLGTMTDELRENIRRWRPTKLDFQAARAALLRDYPELVLILLKLSSQQQEVVGSGSV